MKRQHIYEKYSIEDINDILKELNDDGRIAANINTTSFGLDRISGKFKRYICFFLRDPLDFDGFYFDEISYYVFRIKDYIGENLKYCLALSEDPMNHKLRDKEIKEILISLR